MPDRTLTFAYTACAVFAVVIAFLLATTAERTLFVLEDSPVVWITENDGSHDTDEVAATVQRVADEHDAAIGYAIADVREPTTRIHLYLAVSDPDSRHAAWSEEGYPTFGRGFTIDTHPIADFGDVGPNGHYLVLDAPEAEEALRTELAALGLHEAPGAQATRMWHYFTGGHLFHLLMVALLGTVTAAGAGVLLGSRDYGVMRLQGRSYPSILGHDLLRTARSTAVALAVIVLGTLVFLGWYNEWNQLGFYSRTALLFLGALTVPCLLVHAATLALVHTTRILPSLKGRLPLKATTTAIYLVRAPSLILALIILGGVASYSQNVRDLETALELHEEQGETSFPSLSANYGWADDEAVDEELGPWLREVDASGDMVLAVHGYPLLSTPYDPRPSEAASPEPPLLIVNDTYLAEQEVLSPTGEPYGPDEDVRVLVPENATLDTEELVEAVRSQWVEASDASDDALEIEVLPAAAEQTLFTYSAKRSDAPRPYLPLLYEPVVVVLPNGGVLSDGSYVSHMTRGSTIFPDPEVVVEYRDRVPEASRYLAMVETLSTSTRDELARHLIVLRGELFNLVGVAVVLLLTAMAACVVHVRTRAQEIFVRHISGWTFLATHRRLLFVEGALALGFPGWAVWDTLRRLAVTSDPMYGGPLEAAPSGAEPFYALGIALVCLSATIAALALFHRRIVREGASQA
ncbi:bacteriocin-associated integral membrane family protein [Nocardiopsis alba]|uniref:bacteriocin-associated integral membrane family protein n=1 Tax=Nocardiopsis alba TaxID=53437 RepID=UPI003407D98E